MNPSDDSGLHFGIESELPQEIVVGRGNVLTLYGWCFHYQRSIRRLEVLVDGEAQPLIAQGMPRPDVVHGLAGFGLAPAHAYRSGFWGLLKLTEIEVPREIEIGVRAHLHGGGTATARIGRIRLRPGERRHWVGPNGGDPQVAICMATFNPPPKLFERQIESIRAQTYEDWICLISDDDSQPKSMQLIDRLVGDDPRFRVERNAQRLGVYRNFERVLSRVPPDTGLVALADQDDHWHPDKLAALRSRIAGGATLAYSDMRITNSEDETISATFWTERANNSDDLGALLIVNSITGGASLFRADILEYVLPFPAGYEGSYHDHWIGMVAMSLGEVGYVDRPLYDYVQHSAAALSHESLRRPGGNRPSLLRALRSRPALSQTLGYFLEQMRRCYYIVLGVRGSAELLLLRGGKKIGWRKRRALRRCVRLERSFRSWAWLFWLMLRSRFARSKTMGVERLMLAGAMWRSVLDAIRLLRLPAPGPHRQTLSAVLKPALSPELSGAALLQRLIEPLRLDISADAPERINVLIPWVDLGHFFGGYIAKFNLARTLAESGSRVRIVCVDKPFYLPADWREQIARFEGLEKINDLVDIELSHDRSKALKVSPSDRFVATTWWTAHLARRAAQDLGRSRFLYLIQEFEPLTVPMGSLGALARQTYDFPHYALFSTELLRDYFRVNRLGVFAESVDAGDDDSCAFENAITSVEPPSTAELRESEKNLLFYARPEPHAERNAFELGLLALAQSRDEGTLEGWRVRGIGAQHSEQLRYGRDLRIEVLERRSQDDYASLLRGHSVGLSLMLTPHPSLVPLEMAAAGMRVVTNTFENKTGDALAPISENLIAVEPTIEGIREGIREAVATSSNHELRLRGARVNWSSSWDESFDRELVERLKAFLERS